MAKNPDIIEPQQIESVSSQRRSGAAYNFIPLPRKIAAILTQEDSEQLPDHDRYYSCRHSGYFDVILETLSPLYIRGGISAQKNGDQQSEFERAEAEKAGGDIPGGDFRRAIKNKPEFFHVDSETNPVIPGSSLRGMLRSLLEIVSYGKMQEVTKKKLFFRTMDDSTVGDHYRKQMMGKVKAGFMVKSGNEYFIRPCEMARVRRDLLKDPSGRNLYDGSGPNKTPRWQSSTHQHMPVWVRLNDDGRFVDEIRYSIPKSEGFQKGLLVITGDIPRKKKEFVFLWPEDESKRINVPLELMDRFQDDDQITQWQQNAFPKKAPKPDCRPRPGLFQTNQENPDWPGDPVFYLLGDNEKDLVFFGRAGMFRLPYQHCPLDLVPNELRRQEDIDFAEAMFGYVKGDSHRDSANDDTKTRQGDKSVAYAGRIRVTDGTLTGHSGDLWLSSEPFEPKILATPKPTAFQHYLVQTRESKRGLNHFDSNKDEYIKETTLRGHKLYWLQGNRTADDLKARHPDEDSSADIRSSLHFELDENRRWKVKNDSKQHTRIKPLSAGVKFLFRVNFENLSSAELGALCWTLQPKGEEGKTYCHRLGMGKSLGMGAVKLDATCHLIDRHARYERLFQNKRWETGEKEASTGDEAISNLEKAVREFEADILTKIEGGSVRFSSLGRIRMLLKMMEWEEHPNPERAKSVSLEDFRQRLVLPDPLEVASPAQGSGSEGSDRRNSDKKLESTVGERTRGSDVFAKVSQKSSLADEEKSRSTDSTKADAWKYHQELMNAVMNRSEKPIAPQSFTGSRIEKVTLTSDWAAGKAKVKTEDGREVTCERIPYGSTAGKICRAEVTRKDGIAINAKFKDWNAK